ncbi:site-2 protease [Bisgaardia hudsonensis]|uniref:Zinc metalloprotease n=1 Tax=Bisgaardia hudsonensis TaxID=109472 RepID=A0A4R2N2X6_9PAST|nr:sigma E protease regulator RseP [Bisgaardia hudsonensis]QLB12633.1 RIP metalloprotease RseP [Bisgaardia hudsonensis]TCP14175.1 site-2 protease [Bisgaardia hudsonensis]
MSFFWSLGSFIIVIGVLIAVHEFGHFWVARKCGIKVHRFSLGFGKVIWSKVDRQGTEFAISMIPLGGYVKMLDERSEIVPEHLKSQSFNSKSVLQRALVVSAGPIANFIFAIIAYVVIYTIGIPTVKPVIADISASSIAAQAQLKKNLQILAIDGTSVSDWESINMLLATKMREPQVIFTVEEFGSDIEQEKILDLTKWTFNPEKETAFESLGIIPERTKVEMVLSKVLDNSPAAKSGLKVGDKIYHKDGSLIVWQEFISLVQQGVPIKLKVERDDLVLSKILEPEQKDGRWFVGISPTIQSLSDEYRTELKYGIFESLQRAVEKIFQLSWLTIKVIGKLLIGDLSLNNLSGPISIAKGAGVSSQIGLTYYLSFMALISVNLGIMNLLPLPVLDGGHLLFLFIEAIKGRPLSENIQDLAYRIGATLLLMLTAFALFNDFLRL